MIEILIAILGIVQGVLAMLNKRANWIVYAIQMVLLVVFSWNVKLYGDALQNFVYFFICVCGWFMWKRNFGFDKVTVLSWWKRTGWLFITAIVTVAGGVALSMTDDPLPYVDSFTTSTTVVGLLLLMTHRLETWIVWFFNDVAYMYTYFCLPEQALYLFCLYVVWTFMAVLSFINWFKIYKGQK